ncbi:MAG: sulfur carrier protein ThiS [Actinomycetota bacterium]
MRVIVNGVPRDLPGGATLADAASAVGVAAGERGVAAAVDGEVVPRADWPGRVLQTGARVEVVRAAAGG